MVLCVYLEYVGDMGRVWVSMPAVEREREKLPGGHKLQGLFLCGDRYTSGVCGGTWDVCGRACHLWREGERGTTRWAIP